MDKKLSLPEPSLLIASALFLMTKHADRNCRCLRHMIIRQLDLLLTHPSDEVTPLLRETCRRLIDQWTIYTERCEQEEMKALREMERVLH